MSTFTLAFGSTLQLRAGLVAALLLLGAGDAAAQERWPGGEVDLDSLADGIRGTRAISLIAKLEVKNKADQLWNDMRAYHDGRSGHELTSLEARFDALLAWLVSLVSPGDPELEARLVASRDAIWLELSNPASFPVQEDDRGR